MNLRLCVFVLALAIGSVAQDQESRIQVHQQDEGKWAQRSGLPAQTVHQLWRLASHFADSRDDDSRIQLLDTDRLGQNRTLLVTSAGSDYCLSLTVFSKTTVYQKIWTEDSTPMGEGFCGSEARVFIVDGRIVVSVPSNSIQDNRTGTSNYSYEWNGRTYRFAGMWKMGLGLSSKVNR